MGERGWRRRSPETPTPPAAPAATPAPTRIELDCEIEGRFALDGPLVVDGEFRGSIACRDVVTVGRDGSVEADIEGRVVEIHGAVVGDVTATREIVLHATARVHGDLVAPSVVVERGAFFQGATRMYRPEQLVRDAATAPTAE